MKLAIATTQDFALFWKIHRMLGVLQYNPSETQERRAKAVILGRLEQLGSGGFTRVLMGCELLIDNCCDKDSDVYDFSPRLKKALALLEETEE